MGIFCDGGEMAFARFLLLMVTLTYVSGLPNPDVNFHVAVAINNSNNSSVYFETVNINGRGANGDHELIKDLDATNQSIEGPDESGELQEAKDLEESEEEEKTEERDESAQTKKK